MKTGKKFITCLTAVAMFVLLTATTVFAAETQVDWEKGVIRATGLAAGKMNTPNKGIKRAQARRAAIMDAQRGLAETVQGVQVSSESSMRDLILEYDIVRTRVDALIKGMTQISEKYYDDDTCEVVLEMPMFGSSQALATAAFLPEQNEPAISFPQPTTTVTVNAGYTGLIIDCRGMNLNPVMSPVIKNDNGQSIYGHRNLDYDKIIANGMASYASNINDSVSASRAGNNPLVVKAVKVEGHNANPVISVADADKILSANQNDRFLDNCAVVFVK